MFVLVNICSTIEEIEGSALEGSQQQSRLLFLLMPNNGRLSIGEKIEVDVGFG